MQFQFCFIFWPHLYARQRASISFTLSRWWREYISFLPAKIVIKIVFIEKKIRQPNIATVMHPTNVCACRFLLLCKIPESGSKKAFNNRCKWYDTISSHAHFESSFEHYTLSVSADYNKGSFLCVAITYFLNSTWNVSEKKILFEMIVNQ